MAANERKWLQIEQMEANGYKQQQMAANAIKWHHMAANGCKWHRNIIISVFICLKSNLKYNVIKLP